MDQHKQDKIEYDNLNKYFDELLKDATKLNASNVALLLTLSRDLLIKIAIEAKAKKDGKLINPFVYPLM